MKYNIDPAIEQKIAEQSKAICAALIERKVQIHMTNKTLSDISGVSENTVGKFAKGTLKDPTLYHIIAISNALGVTIVTSANDTDPASRDAINVELTAQSNAKDLVIAELTDKLNQANAEKAALIAENHDLAKDLQHITEINAKNEKTIERFEADKAVKDAALSDLLKALRAKDSE